MEFKHTIMQPHPLRNCWMVWMPEIPYVPPYFGSKKKCEKVRVYAESQVEKYLNKYVHK